MTKPGNTGATVDPAGRLADNIVYFGRLLRKAGVPVGPAAITDAIEATITAGIGTREEFYWTLHSVMINRREDHLVFDEAFSLFWRSRELIEKMLSMFSPQVDAQRHERKKPGQSRVSDALFAGHSRTQKPDLPPQIDIDARMSVSGREVLRQKDFTQMTAEELAEAKRAIAQMRYHEKRFRTRRFTPSKRGQYIDTRATMKRATRPSGALLLPQMKAHKTKAPPLVVLADISGSMSQYSRIFLHFIHAMIEGRRDTHAFVFGTRLTNITRQMRHRDIDAALDGCAHSVSDWSGGTRIGDALENFNRLWLRRVVRSNATVLLMSDGLERDEAALLGKQMERLHKSCRRLVWLNPLMRFDAFEPRARGIRSMLAHVDEFRPVHTLDTLVDLCTSLNQGFEANTKRLKSPREWLERTERVAA